MRISPVLILLASVLHAQTAAETLIEAGHWKRARAIVEARIHDNPQDALANYLLSQIRNAFGDYASPLGLAEKAVAIDGTVAKYHRQLAEVLGVKAQHANLFQQLALARHFKKEIDTAISLDSRDLQAQRDLLEFYLLAPGIAGGGKAKAQQTAARIAAIDPSEGFSAQARLAAPSQIGPLLEKAVEAAPMKYRPRIALAKFQQSERQAEEARKIDPSRVDAYSLLAKIYATRSQWQDLDQILETASRAVPDDLQPLYHAAQALLATNQAPDRATRYLRQYAATEPEGNAPRTSPR